MKKMSKKLLMILIDQNLKKGPDCKTLIFRCFTGEKVEVKLLVSECNLERENALVMASEMVIYE